MGFGQDQEDGISIIPIALAHPPHPITKRSRNKRRNLWFGWCVDVFPSGNLGSGLYTQLLLYTYHI